MPHPGGSSTPIPADPVAKDLSLDIPYRKLSAFKSSPPNIPGGAPFIGQDLSQSALDAAFKNNKGDVQARFVYSPSRANDTHPAYSGVFQLPDDVKVNAAYIWVPDNHDYMDKYDSHDKALKIKPVHESYLILESGKVEHSFVIDGVNTTDAGHWIIYDILFSRRTADEVLAGPGAIKKH